MNNSNDFRSPKIRQGLSNLGRSKPASPKHNQNFINARNVQKSQLKNKKFRNAARAFQT